MKPAERPSADASRLVAIGLLALIVLTLGFGVWSTTTRITGAIIATGKVEVERNRQVVQHPGGGVVAEILVDDGTFIEADQVLLRLDVSEAEAELAYARLQLFDLMSRQDRLMAEASGAHRVSSRPELDTAFGANSALTAMLDGQERLFEANVTSQRNQTMQLRQQQSQIRAGIEGISAQLSALAVQSDLVTEALADQKDLLAKGLSQAAELLRLRREQSVLDGRQGELRANIAAAEERISEAENEILLRADEFRGQSISALRDLEEPLRGLRHRVRQLQAQIAAADIRAPTSGIVYQLAVHTPRAVVRPAEPLLYLVPQDRPRVIAAHVTPQHIDQVRIGQEVKMRLSALNARTTPEVFGRITEVSADAIEDQLRGGHYYRVEVQLSAGELGKLPEGTVLLPGMPVETFIQTGERSPMAYLIKPISDYLARAFRES
jgi:HlyD family secretion protein